MANKITGRAPSRVTYEFYALQNADGSWYARYGEAGSSFYDELTTYSYDTEQQALTEASHACLRLLALA